MYFQGSSKYEYYILHVYISVVKRPEYTHPEERARHVHLPGAQFTCLNFLTITKVQILTPAALRARRRTRSFLSLLALLVQKYSKKKIPHFAKFICFTSAKVWHSSKFTSFTSTKVQH